MLSSSLVVLYVFLFCLSLWFFAPCVLCCSLVLWISLLVATRTGIVVSYNWRGVSWAVKLPIARCSCTTFPATGHLFDRSCPAKIPALSPIADHSPSPLYICGSTWARSGTRRASRRGRWCSSNACTHRSRGSSSSQTEPEIEQTGRAASPQSWPQPGQSPQ